MQHVGAAADNFASIPGSRDVMLAVFPSGLHTVFPAILNQNNPEYTTAAGAVRITPATLKDTDSSEINFVFNQPVGLLKPLTVMTTHDRLKVSVGGSSFGAVGSSISHHV